MVKGFRCKKPLLLYGFNNLNTNKYINFAVFNEGMIVLDDWQKEVLKTDGNICIRAGRQTGKSTIVSIKAGKFATENANKTVMVISKTERQAELLFSKILLFITMTNKAAIKTGKARPTKHKIELKNGSIIYCLPTGETGFGIMGYTIHLLIADEAAWIPEEVWNSVIPALAITRGNIWVLSTPWLKEGFFYDCFADPTFTAFHTTSEQCPRRDDVFLEHKKATLGKMQYAQMYLGEFLDEFLRFFPKALIERAATGEPRPKLEGCEHNIGCDVGRIEDPFTFEIGAIKNDRLIHIYHDSVTDKPVTENAKKIIELNKIYDFKKEFIDSGGMGIAVCDILREDPTNKKKVVEINNASRPYTRDDKRKKILKEDLYNNLKTLMELSKITILNNSDVKDSLASITAEFNERGRMIITGNNAHIAEGLIRLAWCMREKSKKISILSF